MRKISETKMERSNSGESASIRRTQKRISSAQARQPLGVNMSFGNSPSTVRQFRRVSPNGNNPNAENEDPNSSVIRTPSKAKPGLHALVDMDSSLLPPSKMARPSRVSSTATTIAAESKEANLGRKLYANVIGISCQDVLNETADGVKREAVARLAEAFSDLESVDPDGMYHIMQSIISKMKQDVTLKTMLPQPSNSTPNQPPPRKGSDASQRSASQATSQPPSTTASRQITPSTPTKGAGAKLVLAQNNPHLKSHRRRQSAQAAVKSRDSSQAFTGAGGSPLKKNSEATDAEAESDKEMMRGLTGGLEHTRQLADVLFERWCEGLKVRWPAV